MLPALSGILPDRFRKHGQAFEICNVSSEPHAGCVRSPLTAFPLQITIIR